MLRTFDELGYRQEQRFHFELGLLKLVHLRRLLPIEEALSQVGGSGAPRPASAATPRPATAPRSTPVAQPAAVPARATFSPFEQDKSRRHPEAAAGAPLHVAALPVARAPGHRGNSRGATAISIAPSQRPILEEVPAVVVAAPISLATAPSPTHAIAAGAAADPQQTVVDALAAAKLSSAADAMADAVWTIADGEARVQTELSKTMLTVVINAEAEKIVRTTLRAAGIPKLTLLPGAAAPAAQKKPRAARSGSVQAKAMEHPMVQQAQKLFHAEIQTVIDLRPDSE